MKTWNNKQHEAVLQEKRRRKQEIEERSKEFENCRLAHLTLDDTGNNNYNISTLQDYDTNNF